jgi:Family of unknown function (DUF5709)
MQNERRHESADLEDYEVLGSSDTLDGAPGDDPLDRGIVAPQRWRSGSGAAGPGAGESLDELLAEEEPDIALDTDDEQNEEIGWDENATDDDIDRYLLGEEPDPRAGRLVAQDEEADDADEARLVTHDDLIGVDAGIDGGGASAEEAAVHVVTDDTDLRPGGRL